MNCQLGKETFRISLNNHSCRLPFFTISSKGNVSQNRFEVRREENGHSFSVRGKRHVQYLNLPFIVLHRFVWVRFPCNSAERNGKAPFSFSAETLQDEDDDVYHHFPLFQPTNPRPSYAVYFRCKRWLIMEHKPPPPFNFPGYELKEGEKRFRCKVSFGGKFRRIARGCEKSRRLQKFRPSN